MASRRARDWNFHSNSATYHSHSRFRTVDARLDVRKAATYNPFSFAHSLNWCGSIRGLRNWLTVSNPTELPPTITLGGLELNWLNGLAGLNSPPYGPNELNIEVREN